MDVPEILEEEWIPVLYRCGQWKRVGIRTALTEAGRIRQIAASNPAVGVPQNGEENDRYGQ